MIPFRGGRLLPSGQRNGLGSGFGGAIKYLLHGRRDAPIDTAERVAWSQTRNLPVEDPKHGAWYMRQWAAQRPRVQKPVYHFGASLAPGEHLTQEQWEAVAERMLTALGLEDHQAVLALHHDRDHEHLHIVVNRVGPDPTLPAWEPRFDALTLQGVAREVERDYGLRVVPTLRDQALEAKKEAGLPARERERPFAREVSGVALEDFRQARGWMDLERRLAERGLWLEPAKRGGGVNVTDGRRRSGVARLDRSLSGPRLAERFGETLRQHRHSHPTHPDLARSFGDGAGQEAPASEPGTSLLDQLASKHATFTFEQLRTLANRRPDAEEALGEILASPRLLSVGGDRFTVRDYAEAEEQLFRAAAHMAGESRHRLDHRTVEEHLSAYPKPLSTEQRQAIEHATTQRDLALIAGRSGAGKTRLTEPLAELYGQAGYRVLGAAPTGTAAQKLGEDASIPSRTLASWFHSWEAGQDRLEGKDVLLIDEASMVPVTDMSRLLEQARRSRAKLVIVGDPGQLPPIGAGDAFRGLIENHGASELRTIYRQADDWQRAASQDLARGEIRASLRRYAEHGRIEWHRDRRQARQALVHQYFEDRYFAPDSTSLILGRRRAEVRQINDLIRQARREAGELGEGIRVNRREFAAGDRLVFRRNDNLGRYVKGVESSDGIRNGELGTVVGAEPKRLRVRLDGGRLVEFDPRRYAEIEHGYAATVHTSQGKTLDRVYVLPDRAFRRQMAYVALTRHRQHLSIFLDRQTFPTLEAFEKTVSRVEGKDLLSDYRPMPSQAPTPAPAVLPEPPEDGRNRFGRTRTEETDRAPGHSVAVAVDRDRQAQYPATSPKSLSSEDSVTRRQLEQLIEQRADRSEVNDIARREQAVARLAQVLDRGDPHSAIDAAYQRLATRKTAQGPASETVRQALRNAQRAEALVARADLETVDLGPQRAALVRAERSLQHALVSLAHRNDQDDISAHRVANARAILDDTRERFSLLEHRRAAMRLITLHAREADLDDVARTAGAYRETAPRLLTPDPELDPALRPPDDLFPARLHAKAPERLRTLLSAYEERIDHYRTLADRAFPDSGPAPDSLARSLRSHDAAELLNREILHLSREASDYLYLHRIYRQEGPAAVWHAARADADLRHLTQNDPEPPIWEDDFPEAGKRVLYRLQDDLTHRLGQPPTSARQLQNIERQMAPFVERAQERLAGRAADRSGRTAGASSEPLDQETVRDRLAGPPGRLRPGQVERLQASLDRLESWDRLEAELRRLAKSRHALPLHGSLPDLRHAIAESPTARETLRRRAPQIYRDPSAALARLEASLDENASETIARFTSKPQAFGRLRGARVVGRSTVARLDARTAFRAAVADIRAAANERATLHQAHRSARNLRSLQQHLKAQQRALAPSRDHLLAAIADHSTSLESSTLRAHLHRAHARTAKRLRDLDRRYLEPLRQATRRSQAALRPLVRFQRHATFEAHKALAALRHPVRAATRRRLGAAGRRAVSAVRQLSRVARQGPGFLVYRLAPPQVSLAIAAVKLGHSLVRDREQERAEGLGR